MSNKSIDFGNQLKASGSKLTVQREAIFNIMNQNKDKHLSGEEIFNLAKLQYEGIGLATIYRTLLLFEKNGMVSGIYMDDGFTRYQLANPNEKHHHHHLICEECGEITDMQDDLLDILEKQVFIKNGFKVIDHRVKLLGVCKKCL